MIKQIRGIADKLSGKKQVDVNSLPRFQRRIIERVNREAQQTLDSITSEFGKFLFDNANTLSDEDIQLKAKELSGKWKFYCKYKKLNPDIIDIVEKYCEQIFGFYKQSFK